jgi:hypothetical protein
VIVLALSCGGCVSSQQLTQEQAPAPEFNPAIFFAGRTEGKAILKIVLHRPERVLVEGQGRVDPDGTLVLVQSVKNGVGPAKHRTWRLHPTGAGRWTGTLSDAAGPVSGEIAGNRLHLAFAMNGGLKAQQWLYLQAGGTIVRNVMVVRKMGVPVARLDETITREPD